VPSIDSGERGIGFAALFMLLVCAVTLASLMRIGAMRRPRTAAAQQRQEHART
jgi:hypothetical protein